MNPSPALLSWALTMLCSVAVGAALSVLLVLALNRAAQPRPHPTGRRSRRPRRRGSAGDSGAA